MKPLLIAALALAFAAPAGAQLYKWVDKDGKTHYADTPPPNQESKQLSVSSGATSAAPAPGKTAIARDKDREKGRQEARDADKKAGEAAKTAAAQEEACARSKGAFQTYADGGRIHKYNEKGERVFLDDKEIEVERERARREMEEACKKS